MPELQEYWDPNEWEQYAYGLLQDRHGPLNVNKVPARHKGDHGLDYYSLSAAVVYQCYAVLEPCDVADRAEKQKAKMTADLKKFCSKKRELKALFATTRIRRWVLLVPLHDSGSLNAHATVKTNEVRKLNLPYVDPDFEVMIQDLDSFDATSRSSRSFQRRVITLTRDTPSPEEVAQWAASSNVLVKTLTEKLRKRVPADDDGLSALVSEAILWFLERENALDNLRLNAPGLHDELAGVISRRLNRLKLYGPHPEGTAHEILRTEVEALIAELRSVVSNLSLTSAQELAMGTLADWLMRCPLDFPPYTNAS